MLYCAVAHGQALSLADPASFWNTSSDSPTPDDVSGLKLWFKPESLSGSDGTAISTWTDSSGNGWDATNSTAAQQPYITNSVANGYNAIYMDGGDILQVLAGGNAILNNKPGVTVYGLVKTNSTSAGAKSFFHFSRNTSGSTRFYPYLNGSSVTGGGRRLDTDGFAAMGSTYASPSGWYLFEVIGDYADSAGYVFVNSVPVHTNTSWLTDGNTSATDSANIRIGGVATGTESWVGWVSEIVVYDKAVTASDRNVLSNYFKTKYGL